MRIDLRVPFAEKDAAKRLGARWDAARKVWHLVDVEDLTPFMRWMPDRLVSPHVPRPQKAVKPPRRFMPGQTAMHSDGSIPDCGCMHVAPWEHCEHSDTGELDPDQLEHLRAIQAA